MSQYKILENFQNWTDVDELTKNSLNSSIVNEDHVMLENEDLEISTKEPDTGQHQTLSPIEGVSSFTYSLLYKITGNVSQDEPKGSTNHSDQDKHASKRHVALESEFRDRWVMMPQRAGV